MKYAVVKMGHRIHLPTLFFVFINPEELSMRDKTLGTVSYL